MSEQIREQISAFLDGELPAAESELLLKRLLRDTQLRDSFGRYALIGEAMRGARHVSLRRDFTTSVNGAIDGEVVSAAANIPAPGGRKWWRPMAGAAVAASVAVVAVVALQQRAVVAPANVTVTAAAAPRATAVPAPVLVRNREALSYTVPNANGAAPNAIAGARLTNYVFAHSQYPSLLGQRDVMTDLIVDVDPPAREADTSVAR